MGHSYNCNHVHIVFSTKERQPSIVRPQRMWRYVAGILREREVFTHAIGGTANHIHLLVNVPATICVADLIQAVKANSSKWMREGDRRFGWQEGYGAFSVSLSNLARVRAYVETQEEHHRKRSFEQEFIALLKKHGVKYDERYVLG